MVFPMRIVSLIVFVCLVFLAVNRLSAQAKRQRTSVRDSSIAQTYAVHQASDSADANYRSNYLPKWYDMITRIPGDWVEYSKETFQVKNIPAMVGMAALTAGLIATDYQSWQIEKRWYDQSPAFHRISNWLVFTGDGRFQFGIVGAFALYGFAFKDVRGLRTASQTTEAILACGGVVQLLKHITGRESPFVSTKRTGAWRFFPNQIDYAKHVPHYDAFPSGHIATAMTTLIVIAENYPEVTWLKPAGYVALGAISSSLVATGIHWWSDIPLGLALGYAFGEIAAHPAGVEFSEGRHGGMARLSFAPVVYPDGAGMGLSLSF